jgi:1,2-phenylacetyl-CoA epoxidase catalytic subunit
MFEDKVESQDLEKMPSEYRDLLGRVLTIQADREIGGPHLYVKEMLLKAPSKLNQLMVARTAAEEMDHYRKIARLAGDIGVETSFLLSIPNQKRYLEAFRGSIESWEDYAVFGFLIDRVGRYQLEEFLDCSYLPLQRVLPEILKEEWRMLVSVPIKRRSWRRVPEMKKSASRRASISGTLKRSICLGVPTRSARIAMCIGD